MRTVNGRFGVYNFLKYNKDLPVEMPTYGTGIIADSTTIRAHKCQLFTANPMCIWQDPGIHTDTTTGLYSTAVK